ncbi:MAG: hypothetical protein C7M88_10100 [Candidatus Arcticimaribacter sp.]|nr:MAG: hypothetical protein C7M88_10100 [Candidatus Arcticimaribacter sp.]
MSNSGISQRPYVHHRAFPLSTQDIYKEYSNVDFRLSFPGRKMIANSLRVEGRFNAYKANTSPPIETNRLANTDYKSFYDPQIGVNACFQQLTTSTQNQGQLELLSEAPRLCKMINTSMASQNDMGNSSNSSELKTRTLMLANRVLKGERFDNVADGSLPKNGMSFSSKPICCLNMASAGLAQPQVKYTTTGDIMFTIQLARNNAVFFGSDVSAAGSNVYNYTLSDLSISFSSVPDDAQPQMPIDFHTSSNVRQTVQSTFSNVSVNESNLSNSVSCSFLRQAEENSPDFNNTRLDKPPLVTNIEYLFNDSTNKFLTFNLKSNQEIIERYLESMSNSKVNHVQNVMNKAGENYGIGIKFADYLDLSTNKFGVNITSSTLSNDPYIIFLYFHGKVSI